MQTDDRFEKPDGPTALDMLSGGIAHEFNNILGMILGYTETALTHELPPDSPARFSLEQVLKAGQQAKQLIQQIITFSRSKAHERNPLVIGIIVKEILKYIAATLPVNIRIRQFIDIHAGMVRADPTEIYVLCKNLITMAVHSLGNQHGLLDVTLQKFTPDAAACRTPPGAPPGDLQLIVSAALEDSPSYQTEIWQDPDVARELKQAKEILADLNGSLQIECPVNFVVSFRILLPALVAEKVEDSCLAKKILRGKERILLIDDDPAVAEVAKKMLEGLGYHLTVRTESKIAIQTFRQDPQAFDLVITDLSMPEVQGDVLAHEIHGIRPEIPILICTGFSEMINEGRALELGVQAFVQKPFSRNNLGSIVRQVLDRHAGSDLRKATKGNVKNSDHR